MNKEKLLNFKINHIVLASLYRKIRPSIEDREILMQVCKDSIILGFDNKGLVSQCSVDLVASEGFVGNELFSFRFGSELFTNILCGHRLQRHLSHPIAFSFARNELDAADVQIVEALISFGPLNLSWPFTKAIGAFEALPTNTDGSTLAASALAECLNLTRVMTAKDTYAFQNISVSNGQVRGESSIASRWIDAPQLAALNFDIERGTAKALANLLTQYSAEAKSCFVGLDVFVSDGDAVVKAPLAKRIDRGPITDLCGKGVSFTTSNFISCLKKTLSQKMASEKFVSLKVEVGESNRLLISTPVIGGVATTACQCQDLEDIEADEDPNNIFAMLSAEELCRIGVYPGGLISMRFVKRGVLFIEKKDSLTVATLISRKRKDDDTKPSFLPRKLLA